MLAWFASCFLAARDKFARQQVFPQFHCVFCMILYIYICRFANPLINMFTLVLYSASLPSLPFPPLLSPLFSRSVAKG